MHNSRVCHLGGNLPALTQRDPCFSSPVFGLFAPFACDGLPVTRVQPWECFNPWPAEGQGGWGYQRHVNLHVFCSHFNCDKELSLGNSFSAWEKALLPFDSREVVVDFLFRDQEERMTGADMWYSPVGVAGHQHSSLTTGQTLKWNSYKIGDQPLESGRKCWVPLVQLPCGRGCIYFSWFVE